MSDIVGRSRILYEVVRECRLMSENVGFYLAMSESFRTLFVMTFRQARLRRFGNNDFFRSVPDVGVSDAKVGSPSSVAFVVGIVLSLFDGFGFFVVL